MEIGVISAFRLGVYVGPLRNTTFIYNDKYKGLPDVADLGFSS